MTGFGGDLGGGCGLRRFLIVRPPRGDFKLQSQSSHIEHQSQGVGMPGSLSLAALKDDDRDRSILDPKCAGDARGRCVLAEFQAVAAILDRLATAIVADGLQPAVAKRLPVCALPAGE